MDFIVIGFFVIGLILILVEVFTPGFAIFGLSGIICILIGVFLSEDDPMHAMFKMALVILVFALLTPLFLRYVKKSKGFKRLTIDDQLTTEAGYTSRKSGLEALIGLQGIALTDLRPAGTVQLSDDTRVDVVTRGEYIQQNRQVSVIAVEGTWLVVKAVQ